MTPTEQIYLSGRDSFLKGESVWTCPYDQFKDKTENMKYFVWCQGWLDAEGGCYQHNYFFEKITF